MQFSGSLKVPEALHRDTTLSLLAIVGAGLFLCLERGQVNRKGIAGDREGWGSITWVQVSARSYCQWVVTLGDAERKVLEAESGFNKMLFRASGPDGLRLKRASVTRSIVASVL